MRIVFLDVETTGNKVESDRIIEIAMRITDENNNLVSEIVKRINPQKKIAGDAIAVHGIADADVAFEPVLEALEPFLNAVLKQCDLVVWHNGDGFDGPIMMHEFARIGKPLNLPPSFDTMLMGRGCTPDGKVPNLAELCWSFNVPYSTTKAHAALYDVQVLADAYFAGVNAGYFPKPDKASS